MLTTKRKQLDSIILSPETQPRKCTLNKNGNTWKIGQVSISSQLISEIVGENLKLQLIIAYLQWKLWNTHTLL